MNQFRWSYPLGTAYGAALRVHVSWLLLLALALFVPLIQGTGLFGMLAGLMFSVLLFGSVLLHEFAHGWMAQRHGIATTEVTLLPVGGLAKLEPAPRTSDQEIEIAMAGTTASAVFALCAMLFTALLAALSPPGTSWYLIPLFAQQLVWANAALLMVNLLPAYPLDCGHVVCALLARRRRHEEAERVATRIGVAVDVVVALVGLLIAPVLIAVAGFSALAAYPQGPRRLAQPR